MFCCTRVQQRQQCRATWVAIFDNQLSPADYEYDFREQALQLCLGVLEGTLGIPLDFYQLPSKHLITKDCFQRLFSTLELVRY
jgi:hypothetical protein